LHGLVFADSLGVPNKWIYLTDKLAGGSFKFHDYYSVFHIYDEVAYLFNENQSVDDLRQLVLGYERRNIEGIKHKLDMSFPYEELKQLNNLVETKIAEESDERI
jgi:pyruvyltransferase